ncbi:hypothetical protein M422DRAFT_53262 [Sphaerobolus stellatus SS14]|uniref:Uncharacterized protein n=1 Tax=Sphaerobolus stellatus (strain SS14) TaxID=990650 RepID=A0A0C9V2A3_SPHS4|nr:hypothetical protein M422DRAFT_53262 [Sphaerobolus stellatus SS14]
MFKDHSIIVVLFEISQSTINYSAFVQQRTVFLEFSVLNASTGVLSNNRSEYFHRKAFHDSDFAFIVHDYFISIEEEENRLNTFGSGGLFLNLGGILYLLNRYIGLVIYTLIVILHASLSHKRTHWLLQVLILAPSCRFRPFTIIGAVQGVYLNTVSFILALIRTYIPNSYPSLRPLGYVAINRVTTGHSSSKVDSGCYLSAMPNNARFVWIVPLFLEFLLCVLISWKAFKAFKSDTESPLLKSIAIQSSALQNFGMLFLLLANAIIWLTRSEQFYQAGVWWTTALPCVMGSRLVLNIRRTASNDTSAIFLSGPLPLYSNSSTTMVFLEPPSRYAQSTDSILL